MSISDIKVALTLKISVLDESKDRILISRLYETLTGLTVSHRKSEDSDEVIILDK